MLTAQDTNKSMEQYDLSPTTKFYPPRDICLPVILRDEAAIEAMIAYAAVGIGNSTSMMPLEAFSARTRSIRYVNERLSDPNRCFSNPTISAIIGLIAHLTELKAEVALPLLAGPCSSCPWMANLLPVGYKQ